MVITSLSVVMAAFSIQPAPVCVGPIRANHTKGQERTRKIDEPFEAVCLPQRVLPAQNLGYGVCEAAGAAGDGVATGTSITCGAAWTGL